MTRFKIIEDEMDPTHPSQQPQSPSILRPGPDGTLLMYGKRVLHKYDSLDGLISHSSNTAFRAGALMGALINKGLPSWLDIMRDYFVEGVVLEDEAIVIKAHIPENKQNYILGTEDSQNFTLLCIDTSDNDIILETVLKSA